MLQGAPGLAQPAQNSQPETHRDDEALGGPARAAQ